MRVFRGLGERREFDLVAADFLGDGGEVGRRGDDVQLGLRTQREQSPESSEKKLLHKIQSVFHLCKSVAKTYVLRARPTGIQTATTPRGPRRWCDARHSC